MPIKNLNRIVLHILFFFKGVFILLPIQCNDIQKNLELAYQDEVNGNTIRALYRYEVILKDDPQNATAHKKIGFILSQNPESRGVAIYHLETSLQIDPTDEDTRKELFLLYLASEHYEEARRLLAYWKIRENLEIYNDLESLLSCELGIGKANLLRKTVDESRILPEIWKKKCETKLSKLLGR